MNESFKDLAAVVGDALAALWLQERALLASARKSPRAALAYLNIRKPKWGRSGAVRCMSEILAGVGIVQKRNLSP